MYCESQGFTPIADIPLITDDIRKNRELSKWLLAYVADSNYVAAYQLLHNYQSSMTRRKLIDQKIAEGKLDSAQWLLDQQAQQSEEQQRFKEYEQLLIDIAADGRDEHSLSEAEILQLLDIALSRTKTAFKAQTLLLVARRQQFETLLPDDGDGTAWHTVFKTDGNEAGRPISSFMPNPTTGFTELAYNIESGSVGSITLYDLTGKLLTCTVIQGKGIYRPAIETYSSGLYLYTLAVNGIVTQRDKLVLIK